MSLLDKIVAAVTPAQSEPERLQARQQARASAAEGSWLTMVLEHHQLIENAFAQLRVADGAAARRQAQQQLAGLMTGHSLAEEAVLYPAMATRDQQAHAELAYVEQSAAKVQLAALEELDPMSQDYLDKLEHVRGAVAHHVYQEESTWFPALAREGDASLQRRLSERYLEEFSRYARGAQALAQGDADDAADTSPNQSKTPQRYAQQQDSPRMTTGPLDTAGRAPPSAPADPLPAPT